MPSVVLGASTHLSFALSYTSTLTVTLGASVSLVISLVVDVLRVSVSPVGVAISLVCVAVTVPFGSKPLASANSSAPNVTLVAPAGTTFGGKVLSPIVKVTVAPGATSVTVILRFGRPPVFVT